MKHHLKLKTCTCGRKTAKSYAFRQGNQPQFWCGDAQCATQQWGSAACMQHACNRLLALLGLGYKIGQLILSAEAVAALKVANKFVFLASDASQRLCRQFPNSHRFLSGSEMSQSLGKTGVCCVALVPGHLQQSAQVWLDLWYFSKKVSAFSMHNTNPTKHFFRQETQ